MKQIFSLLLAIPFVAFAAPTLKEVDRIQVPGQTRWDYLTIDSAAHRLYVSHATVTDVIDTQSDKVVGTIQETLGVHGIAIAGDLGIGFISNGKADTVTVFDLKTLKMTSTIKVGANPDAILYDPSSKRVMTFNGKSKDVTVVDAVKRMVVATVPIGGKPEFAQLGDAGKVWFNVEDTNEMAVLDPATARLVRRFSIAPCVSPSGLAVDEQLRMYAVCDNKQMVVVDANDRVLARPPIGAGSDGVAWLDGAAWSANGDDGTISVVAETTPGHFETLATIPSEAGARTIAADPATHRLYLPTAQLAPAVKGAEHRTAMPGTFHILVLEKLP